jgi:MFS family permease
MGSTVEQTRGIAAYRSVLATPRVRPLILAALLARMPISMGAVGMILFVHGETGSFGTAGIVTGAFTIGIGVTGPILARLIDRRGTRPVIIPGALVTAAALVAVVILGRAGAGTVPLLVAAAIAGAGTPPVGSVLRQHWPQLIPPAELETAYALDAVSMELIFVVGPLLAGILAATAGPAIGLLAAAALGAAGKSASTACSPSRRDTTPTLSATGSGRCARRPSPSSSSQGCPSAAASARSTSPCPPSAPTTAPPRWADR